MNVILNKPKLSGSLDIIASKSIMHRALISASLSDGTSVLDNVYISDDIVATIDVLEKMGAVIIIDGKRITVTGMKNKNNNSSHIFDCHESGSTIRFLIPIASALGIDASFVGKGKLNTRPLSIYKDCLAKKNVLVDYDDILPFKVKNKLTSGDFIINGDVSSQFITGLLFALPLLDGDSKIKIIPPFESKDYVNITCDVLKNFGIEIEYENNCYFVKGNQSYTSCNYSVEGDYSQSAFFLVANCLGADIKLKNLNPSSVQGDKYILNILSDIGVSFDFEESINMTPPNKLKAFNIDASNIPDLVPILCVLASFCDGISHINNVERLKIKESDRIKSSIDMINALGGNASYADNCIKITPCNYFTGGTIDTHNDHRIAMSATVASIKACGEVKILNAQCVNKSYPDFFEDIQKLGGNIHVIDVE